MGKTGIQLDDIHDITDYSEQTIWALIARLKRSTTFEHRIYRETELDEMWRLVNLDLSHATELTAHARSALTQIKDAVRIAHDLVGIDEAPTDAADVLLQVIHSGVARA